MNTAATLVQDLPELRDVMFAIESQRETIAAQAQAAASSAVPLITTQQRRHLRADSRARAWIPAHLLDTLL